MTITASAAHAATKVSGEDHDAIVTGLRQLTTNSGSDKLGDFLETLMESVLEKREEPVTTTVATPAATAKSGKAAGGSGKSGKGSKMPSSVLNGSPVLLSDESGAIIPLVSQCFASHGGRGYPCSTLQALSAALLDKDVDSRLDGEKRIIYNQLEEDDIAYFECNDGICDNGSFLNLSPSNLGEFYSGEGCLGRFCSTNSGDDAGKPCTSNCNCGSTCGSSTGTCSVEEFREEFCDDDYLLYCCSDQPQFNEGILGD